ncbi:MAG TPA: amidohydrolase family protein [Thermoleophilaceae bacterium]|nr:amidohydrolase family protein [Thermoleophilaceae bacterium]
MVIDAHTHVWPDAIAGRALAGSVRDLERFGDGRVDSLIATMDAAGIDRSVCLGVANSGDRVEAANRFAGSLDRDRLIGFGSIHPDLSAAENVASLRRHGLVGAKSHPLFQSYSLDDPRLLEILDALRGEFAVIVHVGPAGADSGARCTPAMIRDIARQLPGLALIACHLGGYRVLDEAEDSVVGLPGVYLDTSWPPSIATLDRNRVRAAIERHGPERVLFASDWPMADPGAELAAVEALGLSDADTRAILGGNLVRLLSELPASSAGGPATD